MIRCCSNEHECKFAVMYYGDPKNELYYICNKCINEPPFNAKIISKVKLA